MRKNTCILLLTVLAALPASAGQKEQGKTVLKDFQPAGTTEKNHKHQQFDFIFDAPNAEYTCRSKEGSKLKAIDWPVGSEISYEINKDKGKIKNQKGKSVDCTIMRVDPVKPGNPQ
jgi:hypothetical protein